MSHELRTPLTSIAGALDIVLSGYAGPLSDRQLRYVDMARQAATRMNQLVDQLLDLARAQAGSITVAAAPVQLDRLAREVIDRYRAAAATKQLTIVLGASAEDISILGDPERLVAGARQSPDQRDPVRADRRRDRRPGVRAAAVRGRGRRLGAQLRRADPARGSRARSSSRSRRRAGASAAPRSACRSRARSSRRTAAGSGSSPASTAPSSCSRCRSSRDDRARRCRSPLEPQPRRRGLGEGSCALVVDDDPRRALLLKGLLMSLDRPRAGRQRRRHRARDRARRAPCPRGGRRRDGRRARAARDPRARSRHRTRPR